MSKQSSGDGEDSDHLDHIDDGCGCAEVWEQLSEQRGRSDDSSPTQ